MAVQTTQYVNNADGLGQDTLTVPSTGTPWPNPGLMPGVKWKHFGQSTNTVAGNTANQSIGFVALTQQSGAGVYSITVSTTLVTANSAIRIWVQNQSADATAGLYLVAWEGSNAARVAGTSFVLSYYCSAAMGAAWVAGYEIIN